MCGAPWCFCDSVYSLHVSPAQQVSIPQYAAAQKLALAEPSHTAAFLLASQAAGKSMWEHTPQQLRNCSSFYNVYHEEDTILLLRV